MKRFTRLHPLQRLAIVVWVALLTGIAGRVLFTPGRAHTVVPIYLNAAERWVRGENVYAPAPPLDVYRYPPGVAAGFVPLTWVPEWAAGLLWRGFSAALLLVGLGAWVRHGLPRPLTPGESGAVFALAALPAFPSLNNGQTNPVIIAAMLLGATAAARSRGIRAGTWLALAAAVKVYPLAVGLLIAAGRPRVLPWLVAGCAAFAAVPFLLKDPAYAAAEYRNFRTLVTIDDRAAAGIGRVPQDLLLALRVWAVAPPPKVYLGIKLAAAAAMAGLVVLAARRTPDPRPVAALALHLGCVWITVLGPATEVHTYTLLGPTAAALIVLSRGNRFRFALATAGYLMLVAPVIGDMFPFGKAVHALALPPVGGLLVLAAAVWDGIRLIRPHRAPASAAVLVARVIVHESGGRANSRTDETRIGTGA